MEVGLEFGSSHSSKQTHTIINPTFCVNITSQFLMWHLNRHICQLFTVYYLSRHICKLCKINVQNYAFWRTSTIVDSGLQSKITSFTLFQAQLSQSTVSPGFCQSQTKDVYLQPILEFWTQLISYSNHTDKFGHFAADVINAGNSRHSHRDVLSLERRQYNFLKSKKCFLNFSAADLCEAKHLSFWWFCWRIFHRTGIVDWRTREV